MYKYYINVPINQQGVEEFESYSEVSQNIKTYELTENEFDVLRKKNGLFSIFKKELGTIIDYCEEERIECEQLDYAIALTSNYLDKVIERSEKDVCVALLELLKTAKASGTFLEIDIFLG